MIRESAIGRKRWKWQGFASLSILSLLISACAPTQVRFPAGKTLLEGGTPAPLPAPDSLRAELELTGYERRGKTTVSAAFSSLPLRKYKLDLMGFPGMVAASFLWTDTGWVLALYEREGYLRGDGDTVELPGLGVAAAPVHDLFSWLWGDFFPGTAPTEGPVPAADPDAGEATAPGEPGAAQGDTAVTTAAAAPDDPRDSGDSGAAPIEALLAASTVPPPGWEPAGPHSIRYRAGGHGWIVTLDRRTGVVSEAVRADSAFRIRYEDYRVRNDRPMPRRVRVFSEGRPMLDIAVDQVDDHPRWKRDPFRVRIPKGFKRLRPAPES
jgi:hypothetical protein